MITVVRLFSVQKLIYLDTSFHYRSIQPSISPATTTILDGEESGNVDEPVELIVPTVVPPPCVAAAERTGRPEPSVLESWVGSAGLSHPELRRARESFEAVAREVEAMAAAVWALRAEEERIYELRRRREDGCG